MDWSVAFDGWASILIGGTLSVVTVLGGIELSLNHERRIRAEDAAAREASARRAVANVLMLEVSNLRDAATESDRANSGDFSLWPLRNQLYVTQYLLGGLAIYKETLAFYATVERFRNIGKGYVAYFDTNGGGPEEMEDAQDDVESLQPSLRVYGDGMIEALQDQLTAEIVVVKGKDNLPPRLLEPARTH